ncbi:hypothetical protein JB92DRAFT_3137001 [Gautieria morchelliformis]|nr:hypothetical protein JB92DRAFT_3137001 [Gautieria morchelliformis]
MSPGGDTQLSHSQQNPLRSKMTNALVNYASEYYDGRTVLNNENFPRVRPEADDVHSETSRRLLRKKNAELLTSLSSLDSPDEPYREIPEDWVQPPHVKTARRSPISGKSYIDDTIRYHEWDSEVNGLYNVRSNESPPLIAHRRKQAPGVLSHGTETRNSSRVKMYKIDNARWTWNSRQAW